MDAEIYKLKQKLADPIIFAITASKMYLLYYYIYACHAANYCNSKIFVIFL